MAWVYLLKLVNTRFQATSMQARVLDNSYWRNQVKPEYVAIYRTSQGRYGIKMLL